MKFIIGKLIAAVTKSRPARGAWIEIDHLHGAIDPGPVAPRTGRVD